MADEIGVGKRRNLISGKTEAAMAKARKLPRVVLTEGAIFHKDKLHESVTQAPEGVDHQMLSIGDVVMLTDEEFDLHRAGGVCLVDVNEVREAAE